MKDRDRLKSILLWAGLFGASVVLFLLAIAMYSQSFYLMPV